MKIAWAGLHFGEEPPVSGRNGSGTVFFSGCTLGCVSCQNKRISQQKEGATVSTLQLSDIFLKLQKAGAHNVNLVTGTHFLPGIIDAYKQSKTRQLDIPIIWNSSGFERIETLKLLQKVVDVYIPDLKTVDESVSEALFSNRLYPQHATDAIISMVARKPLKMKATHIIQGVIVRHLVLPGYIEATHKVLRWFHDSLTGHALLSVMFQYTPVETTLNPQLHRRLSQEEYIEVMQFVEDLGIEEGYIQDLETDRSWLPDFNRRNPFPSHTARTIWTSKSSSN